MQPNRRQVSVALPSVGEQSSGHKHALRRKLGQTSYVQVVDMHIPTRGRLSCPSEPRGVRVGGTFAFSYSYKARILANIMICWQRPSTQVIIHSGLPPLLIIYADTSCRIALLFVAFNRRQLR